jgi:hypothetical protein
LDKKRRDAREKNVWRKIERRRDKGKGVIKGAHQKSQGEH